MVFSACLGSCRCLKAAARSAVPTSRGLGPAFPMRCSCCSSNLFVSCSASNLAQNSPGTAGLFFSSYCNEADSFTSGLIRETSRSSARGCCSAWVCCVLWGASFELSSEVVFHPCVSSILYSPLSRVCYAFIFVGS